MFRPVAAVGRTVTVRLLTWAVPFAVSVPLVDAAGSGSAVRSHDGRRQQQSGAARLVRREPPAVSPGPVRTPGWTAEGRLADGMAAASGMTRDHVLDQAVPASVGVTLGRMGEPDEIAAAVAFLLGPEARWITGTDLVVDGGALKTA